MKCKRAVQEEGKQLKWWARAAACARGIGLSGRMAGFEADSTGRGNEYASQLTHVSIPPLREQTATIG